MAETQESQSEKGKDPKEMAIDLFRQAYGLQMKGELDKAAGLYRKSIEVFPTAEAYTFLGWTLSFMGKYDEAIVECRKAIQVDPDFGNPYNDIGAYLIEKGRMDEAIPWLEKATQAKRYESYCFPHYNLGRIWEKKGDWDRAIAYYESAVKSNPDYTLAFRALNRLLGLLN